MQVRDDAVARLMADLGAARRAAGLTSGELSELAQVHPMQLFVGEHYGAGWLESDERERIARALLTVILSRRRVLAGLVPEERRVMKT